MTEPSVRYAVGDRVGVAGPQYAGRAFTVQKVNPKTYILAPEDGQGRTLRASREYVTAPPDPGAARPAAPQAPAYLPPGTLVRYKGLKAIAGIAPGGLAVVITDKFTKVNIARLGGHDGEYMRTAHYWLEVVDPATVLR